MSVQPEELVEAVDMHPLPVPLHAGGEIFVTTTDTILKDQNSYFSALLVQKQLQGGNPFFVDRDGSRFKHVLNYLRNGTVHINDVPTLEAILEEAVYFQLQALKVCEHLSLPSIYSLRAVLFGTFPLCGAQCCISREAAV